MRIFLLGFPFLLTPFHSWSMIEPYTKNSWYWQVDGSPMLLRGGSDDDNLFQWPVEKLLPHLDDLKAAGGNFLRNTLSTRDEGNALPYLKVKDRFELSQWNPEFWERLDRFLKETQKRGIVVQVTLWDQHDFAATNWTNQFWNPRNNNIGLESSGIHSDRGFFNAVKERNALLLPYQMKFVEKVLSCTLNYDHVLYNITNEGWAGLEWEVFWARFIHSEAALRDKQVQVTTMEHSAGLSVDAMLEFAEVFQYAEISQNNNSSTGYDGREHYDHILRWRKEIEDAAGPRPMVNEKIYGSPNGRVSFGSGKMALRRFWRNVFAGSAVVRFHRPDAGLGLGTTSVAALKGLSMFLAAYDIFHADPAPDRILQSTSKEAYCLVAKNGDIALYLPDGGSVMIVTDTPAAQVRGLLLSENRWIAVNPEAADGQLQLPGPSEGAVIWICTQ